MSRSGFVKGFTEEKQNNRKIRKQMWILQLFLHEIHDQNIQCRYCLTTRWCFQQAQRTRSDKSTGSYVCCCHVSWRNQHFGSAVCCGYRKNGLLSWESSWDVLSIALCICSGDSWGKRTFLYHLARSGGLGSSFGFPRIVAACFIWGHLFCFLSSVLIIRDTYKTCTVKGFRSMFFEKILWKNALFGKDPKDVFKLPETVRPPKVELKWKGPVFSISTLYSFPKLKETLRNKKKTVPNI